MIRFQQPQLPPTSAIDRYLDLAREDRWFSNGGPCQRLLSERLADRTGAYCTPVASGTLGLMVGLIALLGDAPSGPVAMPSFTFVATAQSAIWCGLSPRLHDVDADHWHLDPVALDASLRAGGTAAAISVSAFGTPPPSETRERWEASCGAAGVPLLVDSAAGFGATADDGVPIGAQGDVEVVSFHATKPFAIGEGGAVFTRRLDLHERIERAVNFGFRADHSVDFIRALNAKMSELHAATALAVLDELDEILERRRGDAARIRRQTGNLTAWQLGCERSTWQFVPVALPDEASRDAVLAACADTIQTRIYYTPLHELLPAEAVPTAGPLPITEDLAARILCLPMANDLTPKEVDEIAAVLERA